MSDKTIYGKSAQQIFEHLAEWMMSLGAGETAVKAVVCILPEPQQQWKLMEWISKQMETHNPVEGEILDQALKMRRRDKMHNKSRKLAYLLRHDKEYDFDGRGWRTVADLVENHGFTFAELHHIVTSNDKQRFEFSDNMSMIRARQGHSVDVDAELEEKEPPAILYHGTAKKNIESILNNGISPGKRLHVHLSAEKETAIKVGKRHGEPAVLAIDTKRMCEKGIKFYLSRNGVWLTEYVAAEFINL